MRVAVIGTGLIGSSIGLALRKHCQTHVVGFDPDSQALQVAKEKGALSEVASSLQEAVSHASMIFIASALTAIPEVLKDALRFAASEALVTDTGSVKASVCEGVDDRRFIGGHPLAGSEFSGAVAARSDLFRGATWYLTPTKNTDDKLLEQLHQTIRALGAYPQVIDAQEHDKIIATISHLPHILANILATHAVDRFDALGQPPVQGPSLRDMTRVAGANPAMWSSIYQLNQRALLATIDDFAAALTKARSLVQAANASELRKWQQHVATQRLEMLRGSEEHRLPAQLQVTVVNKPGCVAQIALALAKEKISILDIALLPAAKDQAGSVTLWISQSDCQQATAVLQQLDMVVEVVKEEK